jgi:hypothetical protein
MENGQRLPSKNQRRSDAPPGWRATIEHYLIFPVVLALWSGFNRLGTREFIEPAGHLYYWLVTAVPSWWCYTLASWGLALALRPWRPPLWVVLSGGYFIGYIFIWTPMMPLRNAVMAPLFVIQPPSVFLESPEWPFFHIVGQIGFGVLPWLLLNFFHHVMMSVPKFGYLPPLLMTRGGAPEASAAEPRLFDAKGGLDFPIQDDAGADAQTPLPTSPLDPGQTPPPILARCAVPAGTRLLALTAQEHYTRVVTSAGAKLLLLRFSDAVRETAPLSGLQVHRSHWVAIEAVTAFERNGREGQLTLSNGETIPVSRSYVRSLQAVMREEFQAA